jgi:hypothetical protein
MVNKADVQLFIKISAVQDLIFDKVDQSFAKEGIEPVVFLEDKIVQVAVVSLYIFQGNLEGVSFRKCEVLALDLVF